MEIFNVVVGFTGGLVTYQQLAFLDNDRTGCIRVGVNNFIRALIHSERIVPLGTFHEIP